MLAHFRFNYSAARGAHRTAQAPALWTLAPTNLTVLRNLPSGSARAALVYSKSSILFVALDCLVLFSPLSVKVRVQAKCRCSGHWLMQKSGLAFEGLPDLQVFGLYILHLSWVADASPVRSIFSPRYVGAGLAMHHTKSFTLAAISRVSRMVWPT